MKDFDKFLQHYLEMLPSNGDLDPSEAEQRASEFLAGLAQLTNYKHEISDDLIKATTLKDMAYANAINTSIGNNAETRKANAEANPSYISAREEHERTKNKIYTLNSYQEVFMEAVRLYRKSAMEMSRGM